MMKITSMRLVAASLAALAVAAPAVSAAQSRGAATAAPAVGVVNVDAVLSSSSAYQNAINQIRTTYAAQIQQHQTRGQALQTELNTLAQRVQQEQARTPRNDAALQQAAQAYQTRGQAAQQELSRISQPYELAGAYAREQVTLRLNEAIQAAATARGVQVMITSDAVVYASAATNMNAAVVGELNRLVPSVTITPPAGYQPGSLIQQRAQAAQPAQPATPQAPTPQPQTR